MSSPSALATKRTDELKEEEEARAHDPDYGVCTFVVNGVTKRYRIKM